MKMKHSTPDIFERKLENGIRNMFYYCWVVPFLLLLFSILYT